MPKTPFFAKMLFFKFAKTVCAKSKLWDLRTFSFT